MIKLFSQIEMWVAMIEGYRKGNVKLVNLNLNNSLQNYTRDKKVGL
ncbi:hypothetical protein [Staphylococcus saccharolyticus]